MTIRAVLFDFGGVLLSSPFEAFARYEEEAGLPNGFIRRINSTNEQRNAWARLERNEVSIDQFCALFEDEARAAGHEVRGQAIIECLAGDLRPPMVEALRRCHERLKTGLLTNNFVAFDGNAEPKVERAKRADDRARAAGAGGDFKQVLAMFDVVVESSRTGVRKPEIEFYEMACEQLGIAPHEAVFLDDLGVNLKPARAMGMTTIKVGDPDTAIAELEQIVGFPLR